jgi:hypothetical protein
MFTIKQIQNPRFEEEFAFNNIVLFLSENCDDRKTMFNHVRDKLVFFRRRQFSWKVHGTKEFRDATTIGYDRIIAMLKGILYLLNDYPPKKFVFETGYPFVPINYMMC